jgi:hypothetical protein
MMGTKRQEEFYQAKHPPKTELIVHP